MSQESVEIVRRWLWAFENDADVFRNALHPDIEWFPIEENQRRLYGVEAAMRSGTSGWTPGTSTASTWRK